MEVDLEVFLGHAGRSELQFVGLVVFQDVDRGSGRTGLVEIAVVEEIIEEFGQPGIVGSVSCG